MILISQDGRVFYNLTTGNVVFIATILVTDFDLLAAEQARAEFITWADSIDLDWDFE